MTFTFRIQLTGITKPPVWRELTVPAHFTFERFHLLIQAAFGWEDYHLYQFSENGYRSDFYIGVPSEDDPDVTDSRKIKLSEIFKAKGQKFTYIYDFGDDWLHKITLEDIAATKTKHAGCIAGKGQCPPEDCGGPWGYEHLKEVMKNPDDPEYKEIKQWLGLTENQVFDPAFFDLEATARTCATSC